MRVGDEEAERRKLRKALDAMEAEPCRCGPSALARNFPVDRLQGRLPETLLAIAVFLSMESPSEGRPCRHAREAGEGFPEGVALADWAAMLEEARPDLHAEPPLPDGPHCLATREAREAEYTARVAAGRAVFHPCDLRLGEVEGIAGRMGKGKVQAGIVSEAAGDEDARAEEAYQDAYGRARGGAKARLALGRMGWSRPGFRREEEEAA